MKVVLLLVAVLLLAAPAADGAGKELEMARLMCREGKTDEALKAAKAAFTATPADPYAGRLYQDLLRAKGGRIFEWGVPDGMPPLVVKLLEARVLAPEKAFAALKDLATVGEAPAAVALDLALISIAAGKPRSGEGFAKKYTEAVPGDPEGHYALGRTRAALGNEHAAISALERAVKLEPGLAEPTVLLSTLLFDTGNDALSRKLLLDALKLYPKNPDLIAGLGEDQAAQGEYKEAAASFGLACKLRPKVLDYVIRQAEVLLRIDAFKEAQAAADKAVALAPKSGRAHSTLGFAKEKQKDYEGALLAYLDAAKFEKKVLGHQVDAAFMYIVLGDLDNAKTTLLAVVKKDPKHFDGNLTLGTVYYHLEKFRDAKKHVTAALRVEKKSIDANLTLGYIFLAEGKAKDAIQCFERVAKLAEFDPEPLRMIGRANLGLGKVKDAIESFGAAIDRDPKDAWSHFDMGKALEENGDYALAKDSYLKAIELDDSLCHPHLYLAGILDEIDDEETEALKHFHAYLDLGGEDPQKFVKQRIKQLER